MSEPRKCFNAEAYKSAVAHMKDAGFDRDWLDRLDISEDIVLKGQYYCADDVDGIIDLKSRPMGVKEVWIDSHSIAHLFIPFGDLPKGVRAAMGLESAAEKNRSAKGGPVHIDPRKYYKSECKRFIDDGQNDRCRGYVDQCVAQREIKGWDEETYELVRGNGKKTTSNLDFDRCLSLTGLYAISPEEPGLPSLKDNELPAKLIFDSLQAFYDCESSKDNKCVAQARTKAVKGLAGIIEKDVDRIGKYKEGRTAHRRTAEEKREDEQYYKSIAAAADGHWQMADCLVNLAEEEDIFPGGIDSDDLRKIVHEYKIGKPPESGITDYWSASKYLERSREMIGKLLRNPSGYKSILDNNGTCGCRTTKVKTEAAGCTKDEISIDGERFYINCDGFGAGAEEVVVYSEPYCADKPSEPSKERESLRGIIGGRPW